MLKKFRRQKGFTLIEVLVFISLLSLLFTAVLGLSTSLLKTAKYNENKILATHYAEELYEWLQTEKELDWSSSNGFLTHAPSINSTVSYCFNSSTLTTQVWPTSGTCPTSGAGSYTLGNNIFNRQVDLTQKDIGGGESAMAAQITVSWREGTAVFTVPVNTVFNNI